MTAKSKILITGANGFLGSHLACRLAESQKAVVGLDKSWEEDRLEGVDISKIALDLLSPTNLRDHLEGVRVVVHCAWATTPHSTYTDPGKEIDDNLMATVSLASACQGLDIERFIFCSSGGLIYGDVEPKEGRIIEEANLAPKTPQGMLKLVLERLLVQQFAESNTRVTTLRISNLYGPGGPREGNQGLVTIALNRWLKGQAVKMYGEGKEIRDYLYIEDCVDAIVRLIDSDTTYGTFNISSGHGHSTAEMLESIKVLVGRDVPIERVASRQGAVQWNVLDNEKIHKAVGWLPRTDLQDGIRSTYQYVLSQIDG